MIKGRLRSLILWAGFLSLDTFTQVAFKLGGNTLTDKPVDWSWILLAVSTPIVWAAILGYIGVFCFWILILQHMDLSRAFPLTSLTYITVPVLAAAVLGEAIDLKRALGISIVLLGVSLIGWERN